MNSRHGNYCAEHRLHYAADTPCPDCKEQYFGNGRVPAIAGEPERDNPKLIQAMKEGKPPMEYIPWGPLAGVARVMATGARKYGRNNWWVDRIRAVTYLAAIFRHAFLEWAAGVNRDKDSGEHPLAHVVACCLIVMDAESRGTLIDDRTFSESKAVAMEKAND